MLKSNPLIICLKGFLTTAALMSLFIIIYTGYQAYNFPSRIDFIPDDIFESDSTRGYVHKPNLNIKHTSGDPKASYSLLTDKHGSRIGKKNKLDNQVDILAVGDSQTCGLGLEYEEVYTDMLEKMTNKTVLNLGVSGYGTVSTLRQIEHFMKLKPKIIILGFKYDHPDLNVNPCYPGYRLSCLKVPYVKLDNNNIPKIIEPKDNTKSLKLIRDYYHYISGNSGKYTFLKDFYWTARKLWANTFHDSKLFSKQNSINLEQKAIAVKFLLKEINNIIKKNDTQLIVFYIPDYLQKNITPAPKYLSEISKELSFSFIDLTKDLQEAQDNEPNSIIIPKDDHLNAFGHTIIADKIYSAIPKFKGQ